MIVAVVACAVFAVMVYSAFLGATKGNCLNNFRADDKWINPVRLLLALTMILTHPIQVRTSRK